MSETIIEYARRLSIENLFNLKGFSSSWPTWQNHIISKYLNTPEISSNQIFNLGDFLREIFRTTSTSGRSQSSVSIGGASWEALVCWYLNLCTINRPVLIIKHNRNLIPTPISQAITVKYGSFHSNTESDLIAITFPDLPEYTNDKDLIKISNSEGNSIPVYTNRNDNKQFNYLPIINALASRDFGKIGIHIIQCKTNWNDNAQIPMLWDSIYAAINFANNISVGSSGYSPKYCKTFSYSFVTVPSNSIINKNGNDIYKPTSTAVLRVRNLSGGNYWGLPDKQGVANSIKSLIEKNLSGDINKSIHDTIKEGIPHLNDTFSYFNLLNAKE